MDNIFENYDRICYFDMDGVLAAFNKGFSMLKGSGGVTADQYKNSVGEEDAIWPIINAYGRDKFFAGLPWEEGGREMWDYASDNFLNLKILTALGKTNQSDKLSSKGKMSWLHRNLPMINTNDIIMVPNKHSKKHYAKPGDILIDDTDVCINEWVKKGGIGILHKNSKDTIRQLGQYI